MKSLKYSILLALILGGAQLYATPAWFWPIHHPIVK
jgi:hypothetical protein